jgi:endonuclease III
MAEEVAGDQEIERLQSMPGVGPKIAFVFAGNVVNPRRGTEGAV